MTQSKKVLEACPMWNFMYLTCNKKPSMSKGGIITSAIDVYDVKQDVLKVGDSVRTIKEGYTVEIDPRPYFVKDWKDQNSPSLVEEMEKKQVIKIAWPVEKLDGIDVMVVPDSHVRHYWKNGLD